MVIHINDATRYSNAQIYKLSNSDTDDVYIGSTNYAHLSKRYWRHRRDGYDPKTKHRYGKIFETDNLQKMVKRKRKSLIKDSLKIIRIIIKIYIKKIKS